VRERSERKQVDIHPSTIARVASLRDASREFPSEPFVTRALKPRIPERAVRYSRAQAANSLARREFPRSPRIPSLAANSLARPFVHTAPAPLFTPPPPLCSHMCVALARRSFTRATWTRSHNLDSLAPCSSQMKPSADSREHPPAAPLRFVLLPSHRYAFVHTAPPFVTHVCGPRSRSLRSQVRPLRVHHPQLSAHTAPRVRPR